jgi:hypothetical protein
MQTFEIAPANMKAMWMLVPVLVIPLVLVAVVLFGLLSGMKGGRFEISSDGLVLHGDLYGRTVPLSNVRGTAARRVDIGSNSEFRPRWRTFGSALPGYRSGWFRLRNGEKALLFVTDASKSVYVPTREGYSIIVSPQNPDEFLVAVQTAAPNP